MTRMTRLLCGRIAVVAVCIGLLWGTVAQAELYSTFGENYGFDLVDGQYIVHSDDDLGGGIYTIGYAAAFTVPDVPVGEEAEPGKVLLESVTVALAPFVDPGDLTLFKNLSIYIAEDDAVNSVPGAELHSLEPFPPTDPPDTVVAWEQYGPLLYASIDDDTALLDENTVYWLVVEPQTPFENMEYYWFLNSEGISDTYATHIGGETTWTLWSSSTGTLPAFAINGPVPIPEPAGGLLVALLGLVCGLRRRRRS